MMRKRVDSFRSAWTGAAFLRCFCLAWLLLLPLGAARPIIVGSDRDFPPYEYVDAEGRPAGFLVDLVQAVAAESGLQIEIRPGVWSDLRKSFDAGEIDVLSGMFYTPERAKTIHFSVPHSVPMYAIFRKAKGRQIASEADLHGRTILAEQGDIVFETLKAQGLRVEGAPSPKEALLALARGKADCAVLIKSVGLYYLKQQKIGGIVASGPPLFPQKYCFAVHRDDSELLSRLNEGLFIVKGSGKYAELYEKHFGALEAQEVPFTSILKRAMVLLLPVGAVLLAVLAWTWSLRRLVRQRTLSLRRELTERRRTEESLRQSEERYRQLTEQSHDLVCGLDERGRYLYTNPNYLEVLGLDPQRLVGAALFDPDVMDAQDVQRLEALWPEIAREGSRMGFEFRMRDQAGEWHWFESRASAYLDGNGERRVVMVSRDVTERRRTEAVLRQTQKLESLGVLAGGIAHDFNNLLTAILGNINLAQSSLPGRSEAALFLDNVERAVLKAADLTKQMLAYSGKGRFMVERLDLNQAVREMTHLLQVSISKKIALRYRLAGELPPIEADVAQVQQVVMNLVTNASDAIGDQDGTITISTAVQDLDGDYIDSTFPMQSLEAGTYVILEVGDTGCGMSSEIQSRIFDPFFTTKATGRGLGLSAMLGILKGHRAGIKIYSEQGKGSVFKIFFPAHSGAVAEPAPSKPAASRTCSGLALLVDDEPAILETMSRALQRMGFDVVTAGNGEEALLQLREHPKVGIVIMDLTMPKMDGREAFRAIRRLYPALPVILSSGYSEQDSVQDLVGKGVTAFIQKPYQLSELQRMIQAALPAAPPAEA